MTFDDLQTLVEYHYWARDRLLDVAAALTPEQFMRRIDSSFPSVRETLVHLCGSEAVWISRWNGAPLRAFPKGEDLRDIAAIRAEWHLQEAGLRAVLARLGPDGVQQPLSYNGFDDRLQAQPFWQMLQHLVNHGTYHRGQITTMLRQLGVAPAKPMDLIAYYRETAVRT